MLRFKYTIFNLIIEKFYILKISNFHLKSFSLQNVLFLPYDLIPPPEPRLQKNLCLGPLALIAIVATNVVAWADGRPVLRHGGHEPSSKIY